MSDFRYQGGGWFRDASIPKGERAEMLHGDEMVKDLQAQLAEARALLKEVEWCGSVNEFQACPSCNGLGPVELKAFGQDEDMRSRYAFGHAPDCRLGKFLEGK